MKEKLTKKRVVINNQSFLDKINEKYPNGVETEIHFNETDDIIHINMIFVLSDLDYDIVEESAPKKGERMDYDAFRKFVNRNCHDDDLEGKFDFDTVMERHLFDKKKCKCNDE